jgi:[ribosomal protein S5]-alanine N-acetyltransferase
MVFSFNAPGQCKRDNLSRLNLWSSRLITQRLDFEPIEEGHAQALFSQLQDPRIYRFIPFNAPRSTGELAARFVKLSAGSSPDGSEKWLNWALRLRDAADYVGTLQATIRPDETALIAYVVFPSYWRAGYAREAAAELIHFLFAERQVRVVEAQIDTRNVASIKLVESFGFVRTATLENADFYHGAFRHEYHYSLESSRTPR